MQVGKVVVLSMFLGNCCQPMTGAYVVHMWRRFSGKGGRGKVVEAWGGEHGSWLNA